jgi:hypothetical protein
MIRFGKNCSILFLALLILAGAFSSGAAITNNTPQFQEIYQILRAHLVGATDAELNQDSVEGLLDTLRPRVVLLTNGAANSENTESAPVSKTEVFDGPVGYLRIDHVGENLADSILTSVKALQATNKLKGIVLDLRYAMGTNYAGAAAAADLFINQARPLLNWGNGVASSRQKSDALKLPVAILVNSGTSGAAEALAAVLRSNDVGLLFGSTTAGNALVMKDFPLKNGDVLRVATAPVKLGNGETLSTNGIQPDIDVSVPPEAERDYYADSFYIAPNTNQLASGGNQTNAPQRIRLNEAELVREHRAGLDLESGEIQPMGKPEPAPHVVSDPALARALDLLKGLAIVREGGF